MRDPAEPSGTRWNPAGPGGTRRDQAGSAETGAGEGSLWVDAGRLDVAEPLTPGAPRAAVPAGRLVARCSASARRDA
ncbi:hypothetical protein C1701_11605 [Actinoalloteichus sp. AHMU CJ021]|nr:hypothetical protein C1701_11605 [Actinoalloteichus sp. AHMU CJ021]